MRHLFLNHYSTVGNNAIKKIVTYLCKYYKKLHVSVSNLIPLFSHICSLFSLCATLGSLSNHHDGNKNPTKMHIWQWKTVFLHTLHMHFSSFNILKTFSFFLRRDLFENDLFYSCADDMSIWWQMINYFVFLCPKCWFQFNSRIVKTHFSSMMTLNNLKMIAETQSYIFRWCSRFHWHHVCLSSWLFDDDYYTMVLLTLNWETKKELHVHFQCILNDPVVVLKKHCTNFTQ